MVLFEPCGCQSVWFCHCMFVAESDDVICLPFWLSLLCLLFHTLYIFLDPNLHKICWLLIETMNSAENGTEYCTLAVWRLLWKCLNWLQGSLFISCVFPLIVNKLPQPGFSSAVLCFFGGFFCWDPDGTVRPASPRPESIHLDCANIQSSNMFLLDVSLTGENRGIYRCWYPLVSDITFLMCVCLYCCIQIPFIAIPFSKRVCICRIVDIYMMGKIGLTIWTKTEKISKT